MVRRLFLDRLLEIYLPQPKEVRAAQRAADAFFADGEVRHLVEFFEERLLLVLSNRDRGTAALIKPLFLSILFDDTRYALFSELELERRYASLLVRSEMRRYGFFDVLVRVQAGAVLCGGGGGVGAGCGGVRWVDRSCFCTHPADFKGDEKG